MFARIFSVNLKPGMGSGFAQTIDREVIPIMRRCAGFRDEIAMVSTDGKQGVGISLWDKRENADAYSRDAYQAVFKFLEEYMISTPVVVTFDVTNSTLHGITVLKAGT